MLLHALELSSVSGKSSLDTEKTTPSNPSLNEVRIDPDSFSFRLDKMLKKLSALKSAKTAFGVPATPANFQNEIEFENSVEVQNDKEEDQADETRIEDEKKSDIVSTNYSDDKEDSEEVNSNPERENEDIEDLVEEKEEDREDLVAAARLEQMINSLSAFRFNICRDSDRSS